MKPKLWENIGQTWLIWQEQKYLKCHSFSLKLDGFSRSDPEHTKPKVFYIFILIYIYLFRWISCAMSQCSFYGTVMSKFKGNLDTVTRTVCVLTTWSWSPADLWMVLGESQNSELEPQHSFGNASCTYGTEVIQRSEN